MLHGSLMSRTSIPTASMRRFTLPIRSRYSARSKGSTAFSLSTVAHLTRVAEKPGLSRPVHSSAQPGPCGDDKDRQHRRRRDAADPESQSQRERVVTHLDRVLAVRNRYAPQRVMSGKDLHLVAVD